MAAMTVDQLSRGRFMLGVGSSHKVQVGPEHGVVYSKPLTRVRETVAAVRQLVAAGRLSYAGETIQIEQFDLWIEPRRSNIPIYIAAVFPKMTALCGETADGIILTRSTLETAAKARVRMPKARLKQIAALKRSKFRHCFQPRLPTQWTRRDLIRPGLALYAGFFPRYDQLVASHGFQDEAELAPVRRKHFNNAALIADGGIRRSWNFRYTSNNGYCIRGDLYDALDGRGLTGLVFRRRVPAV